MLVVVNAGVGWAGRGRKFWGMLYTYRPCKLRTLFTWKGTCDSDSDCKGTARDKESKESERWMGSTSRNLIGMTLIIAYSCQRWQDEDECWMRAVKAPNMFCEPRPFLCDWIVWWQRKSRDDRRWRKTGRLVPNPWSHPWRRQTVL